jgi:2-polyprenyl-3-methyl-5-hydroxy-6-metoxy-1,4-benzoquinol methylase
MFSERYFIAPSLSDFGLAEGSTQYAGYSTYSHYNYLRPGIVSKIKRQRFEQALRLVADRFGKASVVDCGCSDGIFLPSLSKHFVHVTAFDLLPQDVETAGRVVKSLNLTNVDVFCNAGMSFTDVKARMGDRPHQVLFVLETLEHVGDARRMWESRVEFVEQLFTLLSHDGVVVISVPKMVGIPFLVKYTVQSAMRMAHEHQSFGQLMKSSFLKNTDALEPHWDGRHNGFNHLKLERALAERFRIVGRKNLFATAMYVVARR